MDPGLWIGVARPCNAVGVAERLRSRPGVAEQKPAVAAVLQRRTKIRSEETEAALGLIEGGLVSLAVALAGELAHFSNARTLDAYTWGHVDLASLPFRLLRGRSRLTHQGRSRVRSRFSESRGRRRLPERSDVQTYVSIHRLRYEPFHKRGCDRLMEIVEDENPDNMRVRDSPKKVAASSWGRAGRARTGLGRGGVGM